MFIRKSQESLEAMPSDELLIEFETLASSDYDTEPARSQLRGELLRRLRTTESSDDV